MIANISQFKYTGLQYSDISDFSMFAEALFDAIDYVPNDDYVAYKEYYLLSNPFCEDVKKSATIHISDGMLQLYNSSLEVVREGKKVYKRSITPSEYSKKLGVYNVYLEFILLHLGVRQNVFNKYKKLLKDIMANRTGFDVKLSEINGAKQLRRALFNFYISDADVLKSEKLTIKGRSKSIFKKPMIKEKQPKPTIHDVGKFSLKYGLKYLKDRKVEQQHNCSIKSIHFKGGAYKTTAVCFEYPSGFKKLRIISDDSNIRYIAHTGDGQYSDLFEAKVSSDNSVALVLEGEIEAMTIAQYTDKSVYAMHSTISFPTSQNVVEQLSRYDKIIVLIDTDSYDKAKDGVLDSILSLMPNKNVVIKKKLDTDKKIDYNDIHRKNLITKEIIDWIFN